MVGNVGQDQKCWEEGFDDFVGGKGKRTIPVSPTWRGIGYVIVM
jgi:hypothetical protein